MTASVRPTISGVLVAVTAAALTGGLTSLPAAAAGSRPGEVQVSGHGAAVQRDAIQLLAGSATHAAYTTKRPATGVESAGGSGPAQPVLMVRALSGKTVNLGALSERLQNDGWTTAGDRLIAWDSSTHTKTRSVDMWNITTRSHRVVHLPETAGLVAATPSGFVYTHGRSLHEWVASTGSYRSWGTPFPSQTIASLVTDDRELVATGFSSGAKVMAYARPGAYRTLDASKEGEAYCYAVDHSGAACTGGGAIGFLPLSAGPATYVATEGVEFDGAALDGKELLYVTELTDEGPYVLYGFSPSDPTPVKDSQGIASGPLGAYGKALVIPASSAPGGAGAVFAATSPLDLTKAFPIPRAADTAGAFALTPGRVAYLSDLSDPKDPTQLLGVQSVPLHVGKSKVTTGARTQVAGRDGDLQVATFAGFPHDIGATPTTTVFARADTCCEWHPYVSTPSGTVELPGTLDPNGDFLEAAGHRVLAANSWNTGTSGPVEIYDTDTGKTQDLSLLLTQEPVSFALTTTDLVYGTKAGVIRQLDLDTGLTSTIYTPPASIKPSEIIVTNVYAANGWVAWRIDTTHGGSLNGMRTVSGNKPSISLPHLLFGISDAGVLLKNNQTATRTWFRPFAGATRTLLSPRQYQQLPELAGHTLAWVTQGGGLKVTRYRY
jgi:hypothetical protein